MKCLLSIYPAIYLIYNCGIVFSVISGRKGVETYSTSNYTETIRMPGVRTKLEDEYLCFASKLKNVGQYITNFEAIANSSGVHHLLLYGCKSAYSNSGGWWKCGGICSSGSPTILYAWAKNAPPTQMPPNVGFYVSGDSQLNYLVLQIHYKSAMKKTEAADTSGVKLTITTTRQPYIGGIYLFMSNYLTIPPGSTGIHSDISCRYNGQSTIFPFGFRVHAHSLGKVISAYQRNSSGWFQLGKGNPQWPQAFYPINQNLIIQKGDKLAARCTYDALNRKTETHIGSTHNDEMCNFYMMYYTPANKGETFFECTGNNIPALVDQLPDDSDKPLPANPLLENWADGKISESKSGNDFSELKYEKNWIKSKLKLGQVSAIGTDTKNQVYIFHRGDRIWEGDSFDAHNVITYSKPIEQDTIIVLDENGRFIKSWGSKMFYMPHGLHIDKLDNVWITDVGLHQVMKFPPGSKEPSLVFGEKLIPGNDDKHFCKPSDVVTLENGEFFIADGYCNSRIIKFSADGKRIYEFGEPTGMDTEQSGLPPPNQFTVPHSLSIDQKNNLLYIADRENGRIQSFDFNGKFVRQIYDKKFSGRLFAVSYDKFNNVLYAINGPDFFKKINISGFTINPFDGRLITSWKPPNGFSNPHDIDVSRNGKFLYVCEIDPNVVHRFRLKEDDPEKIPNNVAPISITTKNITDLKNNNKIQDENIEEMKASIIIGSLLLVPVAIIILVVVLIRLKKRGKISYVDATTSFNKLSKLRQNSSGLNIGQFFNRHKGFNRLSTEDGELDHLNSDSEVEDYSTTTAIEQKA